MFFDVFTPTGANPCPTCGAEPSGCASAGANGRPFYLVRCGSCGRAGPSGLDMNVAIDFWNANPIYDGAKESK